MNCYELKQASCHSKFRFWLLAFSVWSSFNIVSATPENRAALENHFGKFLSGNLTQCTTCHLPSDNKNPESLDEFPHNSFGSRLRAVGKELVASGRKKDIPTRVELVANEDSDSDGVDNLTELLLGHAPGDSADKPTAKELGEATKRHADFAAFLKSYRWRPFETVKRPEVPKVKNSKWVRNPIDAFIAVEHESRKLKPRPEAPKDILLRRVYLDLIGLSPTPQELRDFEKDKSLDAYEKVVDRLLADARYGERWGRHWMDVWRYSDWGGYNAEVRDSKPHIWRWRDWIVESLNEDKGYDNMVVEMLAADELYPDNTNAVRATGFLVRNYKMLSREQWLGDTVEHTAKAFLGLTMNCAKCHDHKYDPVSQEEYFQMRAIFEPHQIRMDRVPGQYDTAKDGLVRVYDVATNPPTFILHRGDEKNPETNRVILPGVPAALGNALHVKPVKLPRFAAYPNRRDFVVIDEKAANEKAITDAREALKKLDDKKTPEAELKLSIAETRQKAFLAALLAEDLAEQGKQDSDEWKKHATVAVIEQRQLAVLEARQGLKTVREAEATAQTKADAKAKAAAEAEKKSKDSDETTFAKFSAEKGQIDLEKAKKKTAEAEQTLADAEKENAAPPTTAHKPSSRESYPETSTGRRLAFARWVTDTKNPLTARVAMNHIWLRHFDQPIISSTADFGRNGRAPTNPQLLDWLSSELMNPTFSGSARVSRAGSGVAPEPSIPTLFSFASQNNVQRSIRRDVENHTPEACAPQTDLTPWSMKHIHRLIVTSSTYRMASTSDIANAKVDSENIFLWRMPSKRMEAEAVRDNLLYVTGNLDSQRGGPEIAANLGLTSKRRSLYLRNAPEKQVEFLKIFDGPEVVECYARKSTVMPHQALALANSELTLAQSRLLAGELFKSAGKNENKFITQAFLRILAREPTRKELASCADFLEEQTKWIENSPKPKPQETKEVAKAKKDETKTPASPALRAREDLILVLFNHNDFVTIR